MTVVEAERNIENKHQSKHLNVNPTLTVEEEEKTSKVTGTEEGMRYSCDYCEYVGKTLNGLNTHKGITHEGAKYPCYQCNTFTNSLFNLQEHKKVTVLTLSHQAVDHFTDQF